MGSPRAGNMQPGRGEVKGTASPMRGSWWRSMGGRGPSCPHLPVVIQQATAACPGRQEARKGSLVCIPGGTHRKGAHKGEEGRMGWGSEGGPRGRSWEVRSGRRERSPGHSSVRSQGEMGPAWQVGQCRGAGTAPRTRRGHAEEAPAQGRTAGCWEKAVGLTAAHSPAVHTPPPPPAECSALLWSVLLS